MPTRETRQALTRAHFCKKPQARAPEPLTRTPQSAQSRRVKASQADAQALAEDPQRLVIRLELRKALANIPRREDNRKRGIYDSVQEDITKSRHSRPVHIQGYVVEGIIGRTYDDEGKLQYHIRWYGYDPSSDTAEPVEHLRRFLVVNYHGEVRTATPATLCSALPG